MAHKPRKRFGQNFLTDQNVIHKIIRALALRPNDTIVEIGPGQGALTKHLLSYCEHITAVEIDRDLVSLLRNQYSPKQLTLVEQDVLKVDLRNIIPPSTTARIIGNLPYNISTPVLFHLSERLEQIKDMTFMLQKEVVERITAEPGDSNYGRLTVALAVKFESQHLFNVAPGCFFPPPKVESAIVQLRPHANPVAIINDAAIFNQVLAAAFSARRKTLRNALKNFIDGERWNELEIDPKRRPETLSVQEFAAISNVASIAKSSAQED